jgi:hypothetical protein
MLKKTILAVVAVFIAFSVLDFIIHGVLLKPAYQATAHLWRPESEMNMPLVSFVTLVFSAGFVLIYSLLVNPKSMLVSLKYGVLFGVASGVSMGLGSYSYMPIPLSLAIYWFIGTLIEITIAGVLVGLIVKPSNTSSI